MTATTEIRRFKRADNRYDMKEHIGIDIVKTERGSTGMRAIFEPGWTWEADEKQLLGSAETCPMHHTGYCLSGTLVVRIVVRGKETQITRGDFFEIPPGRDAFVSGEE